MINGLIYRDMVISAANAVGNAKEDLNALNVFPVPDGDTGINMSLTLQAAKKEMLNFSNENLSECADKVAGALLRGARGNSGVILSLFFRGLAKELKGKAQAESQDFVKALRGGVDAAYKSVMKPTEGTILTVMRVMTQNVEEIIVIPDYDLEIKELFTELVKSAAEILAKTPEMLPVLKQANVVDAGGKGFLTVIEGMNSVIQHNTIIDSADLSGQQQGTASFAAFDTQNIKFAYCTECIVDKKPEFFNLGKTSAFECFVMNLGDSVVYVDDSEIIKIHVHTNDPGKILSEALKYGSLSAIKVENMKEQHTNLSQKETQSEKQEEKIESVNKKPDKKYGFVCVCAGEGIRNVFNDLGVDNIVYGGQTMNPSTEDILNAINKTSAENVFILPNNKNICMAAEQTAPLVKDKNVIIIKTHSVPQGISAMLTYNQDDEPEIITNKMIEAMNSVQTIRITYAARNSVFDNSEIKEGQILGLVEGEVRYISDNQTDCMISLVKDIKNTNYITVFYGEDVTEQAANEMVEVMQKQFGEEKEIMLINGGQPVYYYIISAE